MAVPRPAFALPRSLHINASEADSASDAASAHPNQTHPDQNGDRTGVIVVGDSIAALTIAEGLVERHVPVMMVCPRGLSAGTRDAVDGGLVLFDAGAGADSDTQLTKLVAADPLRSAEALRALIGGSAELLGWLTGLGVQTKVTALARRPGLSLARVNGDGLVTALAGVLIDRLRLAELAGPTRLRIAAGSWPVDLLTDSAGNVGGLRLLGADGAVHDWRAGAVVLADGGLGPQWAPGPASQPLGTAMALRAGAQLRDLEFVSPTVLFEAPTSYSLPGDQPVPLALVGPASRTPTELDGRDFPWQVFPRTLQFVRERGIDPSRDRVPMRSGASLRSGGIAIAPTGATSLTGLWAGGHATSTGALGVDPWPSLELTEQLVVARRLAATLTQIGPISCGEFVAREPAARPVLAHNRDLIIRVIGDACTAARDHDQLRNYLTELERLPTAEQPGPADIEVDALRTVAAAIISAAIARPETRGVHLRADHPETSPRWVRHIFVALDTRGVLRITARGASDHASEQ